MGRISLVADEVATISDGKGDTVTVEATGVAVRVAKSSADLRTRGGGRTVPPYQAHDFEVGHNETLYARANQDTQVSVTCGCETHGSTSVRTVTVDEGSQASELGELGYDFATGSIPANGEDGLLIDFTNVTVTFPARLHAIGAYWNNSVDAGDWFAELEDADNTIRHRFAGDMGTTYNSPYPITIPDVSWDLTVFVQNPTSSGESAFAFANLTGGYED